MQRRQFIQVMGGMSGIILVPSVLGGCAAGTPGALSPWDGPQPAERDIRIQVLSYAILAPNPHNKQPWIVELTGPDSFRLYVDPTRLLPETDPPFRQIHIGQGTFLENMDIAARHFGYRATVAYFPDGMYENTVLERKPVAEVQLARDPAVKADPLFAHLTTRQSNKRPYDGTPLSKDEIAGILRAYDTSEYKLTVTTDPARLKELAAIAGKAMAIETLKKKRNEETLKMLRFNDEETERYRDGFGPGQVGVTGLKKWVAEKLFLSREAIEADDREFNAKTIELAHDQAGSAAAFGWITSPTNTRLDQVKVGRAYARINLTSTSLGVAQHPMSQVLQEYPDMADLQRKLLAYLDVPAGHTVQMFFRLGHADPVVHAPRRRVADLLRKPPA